MKQSSGMTWQQIADIINAALDQNFGESAYRKKYQMFQQGLKACEKQIFSDDEYLKEIQRQTDELYKAKKQFYHYERRKEMVWFFAKKNCDLGCCVRNWSCWILC